MKRNAALIILLLFIGIGFGIYTIFQQESRTAAAESAAAAVRSTAPPDAAPAPAATPTATPTATPLPTMPPTPSPTPSPSPSPVPTATPVPTPTPYIVREDSGSFRSDTGNWLNLIVRYNVKREGEEAVLTLDAYAESFTLQTAKREDLRFVIDGVVTTAFSGPITVTENELTETLLGSVSANVTPGSEVRVDVSWAFNGEMGGKHIDKITASSTIQIP